MKILLTGRPGVGKTTLIVDLISKLSNPFWIISEEIVDDRERTGFKAKTSTGMSGIFVHKTEVESPEQIGDYKVDIGAVDKLFSKPIASAPDGKNFILIDEIGRMQMLSPQFQQAVKELFDKDVNILATIRHDDEWTKEFRDLPDVITFTLTTDNRESVRDNISVALASTDVTDKLPAKQRARVYKMAKDYLAKDQQIQIRKLFRNTIFYLADGKINKTGDVSYEVQGNHDSHKVSKENGEWHCDCDLANGQGDYIGKQGECSHIQSSKLVEA